MNNTIRAPGREKSLHFEIMRLLAIFFVIHTHTQDNGYYLFSRYPETEIAYWVYLAISIFGAFAVPLFFAVSGALMLNRPAEPLKQLWTKRVLRYGCLLVLVCSLYYFQMKDFDPSRVNLKELIIVLYSYSAGSITWYLYSYLAYLMLLPVLGTLARNLSNTHYYYLFAIVLVYRGLIPVAEYLVFQGSQSLNPSFNIGWVAENIVVYPLLGYFLEHRVEKERIGRILTVLWPANVAAILLSCAMTAYQGRLTGGYMEGASSTFFTCFAMLNCACVYLSVVQFTKKHCVSDRIRRLTCLLGGSTLGIYAFHQLCMNLGVNQRICAAIASLGMNPMIASMVYCLYILLLCAGITLVLKRLPVLKKLL